MRQLLRRVWYLINKRRLEAELAEEMDFHRERSGARAFGAAPLAQNHSRDVWVPGWLQDVAQDVRFAARLLIKDRRFTLTAVVALSLGIAANNTIFTFINTTFFRDLPFADPGRVVALQTIDRKGETHGASFLDFRDWRSASRTFTDIAATTNATANISDDEWAPERVNSAFVSANAFPLIGRAPIAGRGFLPDDDKPGAPPVVLLGYPLWQHRYGGDPSTVGRTIRINGTPTLVVGVMPDDFRFPGTANLWQPLAAAPGFAAWPRDQHGLSIIGRLADGVTLDQASAEIASIADRLAREYPTTNTDVRAMAAPMLHDLREGSKPILMTMMGAVAFVLLIACANVANLLLARAASRQREIAIRASLGASRARIVRQLLIESLLIASLAGAAAFVLSLWSIRYFGVAFDAIEAAGTSTPFWVNLRMNGPVFAFLAAVCIGSSVAFGLVPALHMSNVNVYDALKDGSGAAGVVRAKRWTHALMIGELALTVVLLTGAGLVVRGFLVVYTTDLVVDTSGIVTGRLTLPMQQYGTPGTRKALLARLDERLASDPAFASATAASEIPLASLGPPTRTLAIEGRPTPAGEEAPRIAAVVVGRRYFETIRIRPVRGRDFITGDGGPGHEAAIVNQRFVMKYFPDADPIGRRIQIADLPAAPGSAPRSLSIVGVVPSIPGASIGMALREPDPVVYLPLAGEPGAGRFLAVVARVPPSSGSASMTALREDLRALDPDVPLYAVQTLNAVVERSLTSQLFAVTLFGLLALIAVTLSAVGLFALTAQSVAQRTREIGVRMALGARASQVVWLFLRRTLLQLVIGLLLGLPGALWVGQLLQGFLRGTSPRDPITLIAIVLLLAAIAIVAAALPTRRATRVDPIVALRYE